MGYKNLEIFINTIRDMSKRCKVYIWGVGIYGDLLGKLFDKRGISWEGYYDNFASVLMLNSKDVFSGKQVDISEKAVYILTMRDYTGVKKQLIKLGIEEKFIIYFDDVSVLTCIADIMVDVPVTTDRIKSFRNMYLGEACFIIGNGPSLSMEDINAVHESGKVSFASNMIFKCYNQTQWRPDFYFFIDVDGIRENLASIDILKYVAQNCKYIFGRTSGDLAKYIKVIPNLVLFKSVLSSSERNFDFSTDCSEYLYGGYTVTYAMLQMAIYMGFHLIYLIGMDNIYSREQIRDTVVIQENVKDHSELVGGYQVQRANSYKATKAYEAAKKYADEHDIKIYNATRGGKLEVFERVDFDSLFEHN